ncbi:MAG: isochorismate synthase [Bacteroidetes bacterium]|nr:MAG: isochorismate synthase [Bacteroidota bacterium]
MNSEDFFESISQQYKRKLPFVAYRKRNVNTIKAILQQDFELYISKDFKENGFVFAPFDDKDNTVLIPLEKSELISIENAISELFVIPSKADKPLGSAQLISSKDNKQDHINLLQKGLEAIDSNQFQKVVLSRQETVSNSETNPISIFKNLLNIYLSAFVYIWYHPKVGLWLGATPETLLKIEENRFSTMALAGTQQYNGTFDVEWNNKEKEEQQIVTDYIVNSINGIVNDLKISEVETIRAGSLLHLQTKISGTLKTEAINFKRLLRKLHPTPAVCGLPKETAKAFILNNESCDREFYTGFLGELNTNHSELFVNLRCMQLKNNKAILYVGGGITKDSIPENEWNETLNKAKIIKRVL